MPGKIEWVKLLFGWLPKAAQKSVVRVFVLIFLLIAYCFPAQYKKWSGIVIGPVMEQFQKEKMEELQPVVDSFTK